MDKEVLRKQIMVSQFVNAVGCPPDQATQFLQGAQWQWDVALSLFLQDHAIGVNSSASATSTHHSSGGAHGSSLNPGSSGSSLGSRMSYQASCVPTNTPATPPAFPDTLAAFAQLKASSPAEGSNMMQEPTIVHIHTQASKS